MTKKYKNTQKRSLKNWFSQFKTLRPCRTSGNLIHSNIPFAEYILDDNGIIFSSYPHFTQTKIILNESEYAMLNGQLKPAVNLQHEVDSEYTTLLTIGPQPTDTTTLILFSKEMEYDELCDVYIYKCQNYFSKRDIKVLDGFWVRKVVSYGVETPTCQAEKEVHFQAFHHVTTVIIKHFFYLDFLVFLDL